MARAFIFEYSLLPSKSNNRLGKHFDGCTQRKIYIIYIKLGFAVFFLYMLLEFDLIRNFALRLELEIKQVMN